MTCSDSGLTPSSSAARCTRSSTAAASAAGSGPLARTSPRVLLSCGWPASGWLSVCMRRACLRDARQAIDAIEVGPIPVAEH